MKNKLILITTLALLSCATPNKSTQVTKKGTQTPTASVPNASEAKKTESSVIYMNSIKLTEASSEDFNLGRFRYHPKIKNSADIDALGKTITLYSEIALKAAKKGDWETYAVARESAKNHIEYLMYIQGSSVNALNQYKDGKTSLSKGQYAILPTFNRFTNETINPVFNEFNNDRAVKVAALADVLNATKDVLEAIGGTANGAPQQNPKNTKKENINKFRKLPEGVPYVGTDKNGNQFIVERQAGNFILHNPGNNAVDIDLDDMGFIPYLREPSKVAKEAEPYLNKINVYLNENILKMTSRTYAVAPNVFHVNNKNMFFDKDMNLSETQARTGMEAYRYNPSYKLAIDMFSYQVFSWPERISFDNKCFSTGNSPRSSLNYIGQFGEVAQLSCFDSNANNIYQKSFFVTENGRVQTWNSLLNDKKRKEDVMRAMKIIDSADAIASVVPAYGNFDAAVKCTGAISMTEYSLRATVKSLNDVELAGFFELKRGASNNTGLDRALNCVQVLPAVGYAAKIASSTSKYAKSTDGIKKLQNVASTIDVLTGNASQAQRLEMFSKFKANSKSLSASLLIELGYLPTKAINGAKEMIDLKDTLEAWNLTY